MPIDQELVEFKVPADFNPTCTKDYENPDRIPYTVKVQYLGIVNERIGKTEQKWLYQLVTNGNQICAGYYRWDTKEREIGDEGAANHLASFWGHYDDIRWAYKRQPEIDQIVEKCASWMHGYLISEDREHTDYDIALKAMDEESWVVILRPNYMPNRLFEFYKSITADFIEIHSYIEDNELHVKF